MAAPTGTALTSNTVGIREDLHDRIFMLNKDEFPFQSSIGSGTAKQRYTEWQTDDLGTANASNAEYEGNDISTFAFTATVRVGNRTQILTKPFSVSDTDERVDKAGRRSEIGLQTMKQGRQIKMDLETTLLANQASIAEVPGTNPGKLGGFLAWLVTNTSVGATGSNGGFSSGNVAAATNGTQRTYTESLLKTVISSAWTNGGRPKLILANSGEKQNMSGFTGIATQYQRADGKVATIIAAADRYVSDFGEFTIVADRYMSTRDVVGVDPSMAKVLWLEKFRRIELARTGLSRKFVITGNVTLEVSNEKAHFAIRDLL